MSQNVVLAIASHKFLINAEQWVTHCAKLVSATSVHMASLPKQRLRKTTAPLARQWSKTLKESARKKKKPKVEVKPSPRRLKRTVFNLKRKPCALGCAVLVDRGATLLHPFQWATAAAHLISMVVSGSVVAHITQTSLE